MWDEREIEKPIQLKAGPTTAVFVNGDLRSIKLGRCEVINRLYFALRDQNWNTIPGRISKFEIKQGKDDFLITYFSEHKQRDIHFSRKATIAGKPDGTIRFEFEGESLSVFQRNRIGLCILHPISAAGDHIAVAHPDGSMTDGVFPTLISPHQPFKGIVGIHHFLPNGGEAEISFAGDVFEMEDQRNWTDASFKTYSTPLQLPFPVRVCVGERMQQSVTISPIVTKLKEDFEYKAEGMKSRDHHAEFSQQSDTIAIGPPSGRKLMHLGLCWSNGLKSLTEQEFSRLASLQLSHIRLELVLSEKYYEEDLAVAADCSRRVGTPLELALRIDPKEHGDFDRFLNAIRKLQPKVSSWTILSEGSPTTSAECLSAFREKLFHESIHEPVGGGTRAFFTEINRNHPPISLLDYVAYSVSPQVHASDELSIVESLEGQRATVESALAISQGKPIYVGPVTLKMQWNPYATESLKSPSSNKNELPPEVDPRQRLLFAAAWTLGSVKALSEAGASQATYYEILGWKGIMERSGGSLLPSLFPSQPGELFPLYFLFKAFGEVAGGEIHTVNTTDPLGLVGLSVQKGSLLRLFITNYGPANRIIRISNLSNVSEAYILDSEAVPPLLNSTSNNRFELILKPNAVAWIDQHNKC